MNYINTNFNNNIVCLTSFDPYNYDKCICNKCIKELEKYSKHTSKESHTAEEHETILMRMNAAIYL